MSLILSIDGQNLDSGNSTTLWTGAQSFTMAVWFKKANDLYCGIFGVFGPSNPELNSANLRASGGLFDHGVKLAGSDNRMDDSGVLTSGWNLAVLTVNGGVEQKSYINGTLKRTLAIGDNWATAASRIIVGSHTLQSWNTGRGKIAHAALWDTVLSAAQVADLWNGGAGSAGKNPLAVASANLRTYLPLISNATDATGTFALTATGAPTYDGADNPNVEAYGGGSTSYTLTVDSGTYSLSGASLATPISVLMATGAGTYSVIGQDITFGGSSVYTLSLEAGAYNVTSETPVIGISMGLDVGSYSITGQDITLSSTSGGGTVYSLSIEAGTYTTTGQDLSLIVAYLASLDVGTYDVTGKNVRLVSSTEPVIISSGNHTISVSIKIGI